jgi:pimeloyl-ACP methyl ester carboxylesterase
MSTQNGVRLSYELGRYTAGEYDGVLGTVKTDLHTETRGIVFCHGSGGLAADALLLSRMLLHEISRTATVHVGDLGGQTWGNDIAVTRIGEAVTLLKNTYGCTKIALVGASMGGLNALNYIVRESDELECAVLLIPATDLVSLRANPWITVRWPEIDAIYGAPPNEDYTGHNPVDFADEIDPDFPMKIWWSNNDPLVYPYTIANFLAARPQTEHFDMGAVSHDVPIAFNDDIRRWLDRNLVAA